MRISDWSSDVCSSDLLRRRGARLDHALERRLFDLRRALRGFDEVGDQVGAPLIGGLDIRPLGLCSLFLGGNAVDAAGGQRQRGNRSEEHTSELQSLMRISYAVFCLKKKKKRNDN